MIPLVGAEAQVFRLLTQVVAIGRHRRAWDQTTVARVAVRHLGGDTIRRDTDRERARADRAEQEAQRLRERVVELEHNLLRHTAVALDELPPRRVVELNRREYEVFAMFAEGQTREAISRELGIARETISNYVSTVSKRVGADNAAEAAALVNRNVVQIQAKRRAA